MKIYEKIVAFLDRNDRAIRPVVVARKLGLVHSTVFSNMRTLRKAGLLTRTKESHKTVVYYIKTELWTPQDALHEIRASTKKFSLSNKLVK